jgi:DNA-directed RNA polymerase specialized sigma24 family protein
VNIFAKLHSLKDKWPWVHWMGRALADHQSAARHAPLSVPVTLGPSPKAASRPGARELLDRLFEPLSAEDRLVIRMLDFEERSAVEVRRLTGWSAVAISFRAWRARWKFDKQFRKLLKEGLL